MLENVLVNTSISSWRGIGIFLEESVCKPKESESCRCLIASWILIFWCHSTTPIPSSPLKKLLLAAYQKMDSWMEIVYLKRNCRISTFFTEKIAALKMVFFKEAVTNPWKEIHSKLTYGFFKRSEGWLVFFIPKWSNLNWVLSEVTDETQDLKHYLYPLEKAWRDAWFVRLQKS